MKRTKIAIRGTRLALRFRHPLVFVGKQAARHPMRTWAVARGGKTAVTAVTAVQGNPEAQKRFRLGATAMGRAARRARKTGARGAAFDDAVLAELSEAASQLAAAADAVRSPRRRPRIRRVAVRSVAAGGAAYLGFRVLRSQLGG